MQTGNATYGQITAGVVSGQVASNSKALDYLLVIAGWPIVYSVVKTSYTLATTTTGSDPLGQFTAIQNLMVPPKGVGASAKGRPEEGGQTIANLVVEILDKREASASGKRVMTDLLSRPAYLFGNQTGNTTTLAADLTASGTTVTLTDGTNFPALSVIYVGQEAIKLGDKVGNVYGGVTPCTRGYRMTDATPHLAAVKVYDYLPTIYRRKVFLYKLFQGFTSTAPALRAFAGIVVGANKAGTTMTFTAAAHTWEMYAQGTKKLARLVDSVNTPLTNSPETQGMSGYIFQPVYSGDYDASVALAGRRDASVLSDGHYFLKVDTQRWGITSVASLDGAALTNAVQVKLGIAKGVGGTFTSDVNGLNNPCAFGWTNVDWTSANPQGDEPVKLILKFLLSVKGDGANDATYDVYKQGIGLGIPADRVNLASFTAIMARPDYDSNQRAFFFFHEPVDAKTFIEDELCKPFGYSLTCGNDGKIKLVQHRSPQHFYISGPNNELNFTPPGYLSPIRTTLRTGVYTPADMAVEVADRMNVASAGGFSCAYSTSTNKFTISHASSFTISAASPVDNGWTTLGFISTTTNTSILADTAKCAATTVAATLSENDVMNIAPVESRDTQIASVSYWTNYDWGSDKFTHQTRYIDAETVNLGDELGAREYQIKAKGLVGGAAGLIGFDPVSSLRPPASGCTGLRINTPTGALFDSTDSWAQLFSLSLLHRYKQPPLMLKATLIWKWNLLEQGDVVKLNYSIAGVIADQERGTETLASCNFEIAAITHNYMAGTVDVVLVGHRWQGF